MVLKLRSLASPRRRRRRHRNLESSTVPRCFRVGPQSAVASMSFCLTMMFLVLASGCFAVTTKASPAPSGRGICANTLAMESLNAVIIISGLLISQDLANQVRWSEQYQSKCKAESISAGTYLTCSAAEWFSGLPRNWTSLSSSPDRKTFDAMFPKAMMKAHEALNIQHVNMFWGLQAEGGKMPVISLFSGCGGLELGLSKSAAQDQLIQLIQRTI